MKITHLFQHVMTIVLYFPWIEVQYLISEFIPCERRR